MKELKMMFWHAIAVARVMHIYDWKRGFLFMFLLSKEGVANSFQFPTGSIKKNSLSKKTVHKHTLLHGLVGSCYPE